jgi:TolA-binding protein
MISKLKIAAYVALVALAIWFGRAFYSSYTHIVPLATDSDTNAVAGLDASNKPGPTNPAVPPPAPTNATRQPTNNPAAPPAITAASNSAAAAEPPASAPSPVANVAQAGRTVHDLALFVGALVALGLLITYDLTHLIGSRAGDYLFTDAGEGTRDPEYELAEQAWVNGKPLEAIEMMRDYLKKNPREQYVALRIAEIYEKDLRNYVAASMEYEEILKKKLPAERWGWAAVHLCNIYSRMGQHDKMKALLERIARDYPTTGAAKKARHNLGLPEPEGEAAATPAAPPPEPDGDQNPEAAQVFDLDEAIAAADDEPPPPPEAAPKSPSPPSPPNSNLPPGFRKK